MVETYYCTECDTHHTENDIVVSVEHITYDIDTDEIHCFTNMYCPACDMLIMTHWEILGTSQPFEI